MPNPTVEEFKQLLLTEPIEEVAKTHVFQGTPFAFSSQPTAMDVLRKHINLRLGIDPKNIIIIGSARTGFSLSPDNFPRAFSPDSDIDVLLVDAKMFDAVWNTLLSWHYPRRFWLSGTDWDWAKSRRDEIYWGWLEPSAIRYRGLSLPDVLHFAFVERPLNVSNTAAKQIRSSLEKFESEIDRRLADEDARVSESAVAYVRAVEKGANDKQRRAARHAALIKVLSVHLEFKLASD
jgi:hypothetical protein